MTFCPHLQPRHSLIFAGTHHISLVVVVNADPRASCEQVLPPPHAMDMKAMEELLLVTRVGLCNRQCGRAEQRHRAACGLQDPCGDDSGVWPAAAWASREGGRGLGRWGSSCRPASWGRRAAGLSNDAGLPAACEACAGALAARRGGVKPSAARAACCAQGREGLVWWGQQARPSRPCAQHAACAAHLLSCFITLSTRADPF